MAAAGGQFLADLRRDRGATECGNQPGLVSRRDLVAQVLSVAAELAESQDEPHPLEAALDVLFRDSRARKALQPLTPTELDDVLDQAQFLCLDLLEGEP